MPCAMPFQAIVTHPPAPVRFCRFRPHNPQPRRRLPGVLHHSKTQGSKRASVLRRHNRPHIFQRAAHVFQPAQVRQEGDLQSLARHREDVCLACMQDLKIISDHPSRRAFPFIVARHCTALHTPEVRKDTGEGYRQMLHRMAEDSGMDTPTKEDLSRMDRKRKGKKGTLQEHNPSRGTNGRFQRSMACTEFLAALQ